MAKLKLYYKPVALCDRIIINRHCRAWRGSMKKVIYIVILLYGIVFTVPCFAEEGALKGNDLLYICSQAQNVIEKGVTKDLSSSDALNFGLCLGFMDGIINTNQIYRFMLGGVALFCEPPEVTNKQAVRIVVKYLKDHPEELHNAQISAAITALAVAFPCKK